MNNMKKYIVCWINQDKVDNYTVFIDDDSETNLTNATKFYNTLLDKDYVYSINLTEIIKSSDY
jgi:hypothetical protein